MPRCHVTLVLICLVTCAALLGGCGGSAPAATPAKPAPAAPTAAAPAAVTPAGGGGTGGGTGGGGGAGAGGGQKNQPATVVGALFQVRKADGTSVPVTKDDLAKLPLHTIMVEGKPQEGPALLDVLKLAGVTDFKSLTITGAGNYSLTLTRDKVDNDTLLDFANRGTVKLASLKVAKGQWPQDITLIKVD